MRFAVDSSVLIGLLRDARTTEVNLLRQLTTAGDERRGENPIVVLGDLVLCEVLRGIPDRVRARHAAEKFAGYESVNFGGHDVATFAADIYRDLRSMGITVYPTVDLMIGAWCIVNRCPLLHADRDFDPMEQHFGLQVVR